MVQKLISKTEKDINFSQIFTQNILSEKKPNLPMTNCVNYWPKYLITSPENHHIFLTKIILVYEVLDININIF